MLIMLALALPGAVSAHAPESSPRPHARIAVAQTAGGIAVTDAGAPGQAAPEQTLPQQRPASGPDTAPVTALAVQRPAARSAAAGSVATVMLPQTSAVPGVRPRPRPASLAPAPPSVAPADVPEAESAPAIPEPGPMAQAAVIGSGFGTRVLGALRPASRPDGAGTPRSTRARAPERGFDPAMDTGPDRVLQVSAIRPAPGTGPLTSRRGSVCGNPAIRGETVAPIVGRIKGCGVANPVKVTAVDGVTLSDAPVMDCDTAQALTTWVQRGLKPAVGRTGGGVASLRVAAHYACRTRNHRSGARLSEHAKGKAIDISAVTLTNGTTLTVLRDRRGQNGAIMQAAHKSACGIFGTTLGPGSDGMHEDHWHFDTARHRNGPYCR